MPTVAQLINALPEHEDTDRSSAATALAESSLRPVPVGRLRRLGLLGTLQAKIAGAYLFYWIRGSFTSASDRERMLAQTHLRTAAHVLDSMNYLRGAFIKLGQTLATFPNLVPAEFVEALDHLHFNAAPMHYSLLREMVFNELGDDPENLFASFEKRAAAAASLGQVHPAQLKTGEQVVLKIQYPGIGRAINADFRNLFLFLLPSRLGSGWQRTSAAFEDLRMRFERETDYEAEARTLQTVGALFPDGDDGGIVVPRLYPKWSTAKILTMQRLDGLHLHDFLATNPSQELRNEFGAKIVRAWYRMHYTGRLLYADNNPGNYIFMSDGRLGLIDFGCMVESDGVGAAQSHRAMTSGNRDDRIELIKQWCPIGDGPDDQERLRVLELYVDWLWRPRYVGGVYDYGDEAEFRRGIDLFVEVGRKRCDINRSAKLMLLRHQWTLRALLKRLGAKVDVAPIAEKEVRSAGLALE
jgi:predicted unusual protein kinase regulating ubiquinone biosynthesis (AarF/ABC1/UbiB family)